MSTHNICFYGEICKIIPELSSNTLLICSTVISLHIRVLISVFVILCFDSLIPVALSIFKSLSPALVAEQAGLSLTWSQNFSRDVAHLYL